MSIDGFVADVFVVIIGVHALQHASNLLRRPAFAHQVLNFQPKFRRVGELLGAPKLSSCASIPGFLRHIAVRSRVPIDLSAHRADGSLKQAANCPPA